MIKIGELAKLFNISIKTIRFYETKNVLNPCEIDRWTGYRYYDETSVKQLSEILFLKKLGFSLNEIKNFSDEQIIAKTQQIKNQIDENVKNLKTLSILSKKNLGELYMRNFINDERVIGKWEKVGIVKNKEDLKTNKIETNNLIFPFKNIYFMPEGETYWVFSWTKGILFIKERACPYEIIGNRMIIGITDINNKIEEYAVYKQIDKLIYKPSDIIIKDDINIPFLNDLSAIGFYEAVDFVKSIDAFDPNNAIIKSNLVWKKLTIEPNGTAVCTNNENNIFAINWSKGVLINKKMESVSEYKIASINDKNYLFMEWKSGDYSFGGKINGFYVFEKLQ